LKQSSTPPDEKDIMMGRILALCYGIVAYLIFLGAFLYAIGFVDGLVVPKAIDDGTIAPLGEAIAIDLVLLTIFALQHSIMARQPFKRWWTTLIPAAIERSTYVLLASLALILVFWQWRPIPTVIWQVESTTAASALLGVSLFGWLIVLLSSYMINHFELFGLQQVLHNLSGRKASSADFKTPFLYKFIRHPLYAGFIIAFWATPVMTSGHLLFAAVTTAYIFLGILLEERDLVAHFGAHYEQYRAKVGMLIPMPRRSE
jgi:protein-S-isoprenylcysteine O-methyltransferase Ste14